MGRLLRSDFQADIPLRAFLVRRGIGSALPYFIAREVAFQGAALRLAFFAAGSFAGSVDMKSMPRWIHAASALSVR
jgi:hypothetical protein